MGRLPASKTSSRRLARNVRQQEIPRQPRSPLRAARSMAGKDEPRLQRGHPQSHRANARGQAGRKSRRGINLSSQGHGSAVPLRQNKDQENEHGSKRSSQQKSCTSRPMARGSDRLPQKRKGIYAPPRRTQQAASRTSLGKSGKELHLRWAKRQRNPRRSLRRPQSAHGLSLHAWSGLGRRLRELLPARRSF